MKQVYILQSTETDEIIGVYSYRMMAEKKLNELFSANHARYRANEIPPFYVSCHNINTEA